ncbi:MAG: glycosyltransferase family 2 protein [Calditrichaeota bacterium]|nr:glycosyltransferase family 2 protein [Calditrichota bacterium]
MKVSVIISTYNSPEWLEKVIWAYSVQNHKQFELIIADDGSTDETKQLIDRLRDETGLPINHVWHPDNGFQKTVILNKAILAANTDYLVFSDGDCLPRIDFLQQHVDHARQGYFLSGGYFKLPMSTSKLIDKNTIINQSVFDVNWLIANGLEKTAKIRKLTAGPLKSKLLNLLTPTNASWNGHNSSAWKSDILAVNGFDERMQYGGEDREFGERLMNKGIKSKQIRYSAICVHLDHERGYVKQDAIDLNNQIRKETRSEKKIWTEYGIKKACD